LLLRVAFAAFGIATTLFIGPASIRLVALPLLFLLLPFTRLAIPCGALGRRPLLLLHAALSFVRLQPPFAKFSFPPFQIPFAIAVQIAITSPGIAGRRPTRHPRPRTRIDRSYFSRRSILHRPLSLEYRTVNGPVKAGKFFLAHLPVFVFVQLAIRKHGEHAFAVERRLDAAHSRVRFDSIASQLDAAADDSSGCLDLVVPQHAVVILVLSAKNASDCGARVILLRMDRSDNRQIKRRQQEHQNGGRRYTG
jgi:hypothetical protein